MLCLIYIYYLALGNFDLESGDKGPDSCLDDELKKHWLNTG